MSGILAKQLIKLMKHTQMCKKGKLLLLHQAGRRNLGSQANIYM